MNTLDPAQRYRIPEALGFLRISRAHLYNAIKAGHVRVIKDGSRTFIPGSEIARLSALPNT